MFTAKTVRSVDCVSTAAGSYRGVTNAALDRAATQLRCCHRAGVGTGGRYGRETQPLRTEARRFDGGPCQRPQGVCVLVLFWTVPTE